MAKNHIQNFLKTRYSNNPDEIYDLLLKVSPEKLSDSEMLEIINLIQVKSIKIKCPEKHYNIFGTGGDFSINISTMAAILASRFVNVVKVGTTAVNSRYGASDFYSSLLEYISKLSMERSEKLSFNEKSKYISLSDLGFKYNDALKIARKRLKRNNELDIYKIVFPIADYTKVSGQVNGVCNHEYLEIYKRLSMSLGRNSWIVTSEYGFDEALPGVNRLIRVKNGKFEEMELIVPKHSHAPDELTGERKTVLEHIKIFEQIMDGKGDPDIEEAVFYNAALILALRDDSFDIHSIADNIKKNIYEHSSTFF